MSDGATSEPGGRLGAFLKRLPKTETHLHFEGALPWGLLQRVAGDRFPEPPLSWRNDYKFPSFASFEEELLAMAGAWFTSVDRYREAAETLFPRLLEQYNVRYLETSFASGVMEAFGLDGERVAEAIRTAAPKGMTVRVFMGIHHDGYTPGSRSFIEAALAWDCLDGLDLHGTETTPLEPWTADLWQRAREAGKVTKAHAGEFCGPDFVRRVVDELGVRRVQHGVRSAESPELVAYLAERDVVLDVCPISNVKLDVVSCMQAHPIRKLTEAGICCTVSTDDPISFGNTLHDEYAALSRDLGFSASELGSLAANGFRQAVGVPEGYFASELEEIAALVQDFAEV